MRREVVDTLHLSGNGNYVVQVDRLGTVVVTLLIFVQGRKAESMLPVGCGSRHEDTLLFVYAGAETAPRTSLPMQSM